MKRGLTILAVLAIAALPVAGVANDVRTPGDCAAAAAPGWGYQEGEGTGRGSFCVSDGNAANGPEFYVGGDATQPCGAIIVAGTFVTGDDAPAEDPNYCHG